MLNARKILFFCIPVFAFALFAEEAKENTIPEKPYATFAGKVSATKVRLRTQPDLDSPIVRQLNKSEILHIVGETDSFFAVQPPVDFKGYIAKNYVLDNVIEANRVNLRLKPEMDAPIIGQLNQNEKIKGITCPSNSKWLEITPPSKVRLYVAKEYVENVGSSDYYFAMIKRKDEATRLLNSAYFITQGECKKPFNEMTPHEAVSQFEALIKGYKDFPEVLQQAKEGLSLLQDNYLQKKIVFLESKAHLAESEKAAIFEKFALSTLADDESDNYESQQPDSTDEIEDNSSMTDQMSFWKPVEEGLFQTWATFNPGKKKQQFYKEQEVNGTVVSGILESYDISVRNKPGDYVLKQDNSPVAYLYSTNIDLDQYVGKKVKLKVSQRGNNHFAFPAYFVNEIQ